MTTTVRPSAARALAQGMSDVARAPWLVIAAAAITMAMALPFAVVLGTRLHASLASQPPVALAETEIDPEWWEEFRRHASGLEATFTPAVLGFAAALDSISGLLDGRQPPVAVLGPLALSIVAWAFLWGGMLRRFERGERIGLRRFVESGFALLPRFTAIAALAAAIMIVLYLTWHRLLFGPVYRSLASMTSVERDAFLVRVVLYLLFIAPLVVVGLIADYARIASVVGQPQSFGEAMRAGARFVRDYAGAVIMLFVMAAMILLIVTLAYGALEVYGGSQVSGWRAVAIGQLYILFRLAMRLAIAASELRLFARGATRQSPSTAAAASVRAQSAVRLSDTQSPPP
jgi:hypothetical protein